MFFYSLYEEVIKIAKSNYTVHGNPRYRIRETVGKKINENGKLVPIRKTFIGKTKKEAEALRRAYFDKLASGIDSKGQYFGITAENWLYNFMLNDPSLQDRTKETYMSRWNCYVRDSFLYGMPLDQITASTLQSFYNNLDAPHSALFTIDKVMKRFYRYLEFEGLSKDITRSTVVPKRRKKTDPKDNSPMVWQDDEIEKILSSFDMAGKRFRHKFLVILAYYTGC